VCRRPITNIMAGVMCSVSSSALPRTSIAVNQRGLGNLSAGAVSVSAGGFGTSGRAHGQPLVHRLRPAVVCRALDKDQIAKAKKFQLQATEVLAELLKSSNIQATASKYLDSLTEEFFMVASTYLEMAKKEGNVEVMKKIENVLEIAMEEKGKTLRLEIQLMNKLLNETDQYERSKTIRSNSLYIADSDGYFYELLNRMTTDVENLKDSPKKQKLLTQIRAVTREVKEAGKALRRAK